MNWWIKLKFDFLGWPKLSVIEGEFGTLWNVDDNIMAFKQTFGKPTWKETIRPMTREEIIEHWD